MTCRPLIAEFDLKSSFGFSMMKSWQPACDQPPEKLKQIYADPDFRRAVVDEMKRGVFRRNWERMEFCEVGKPELKRSHRQIGGPDRARAGPDRTRVRDGAGSGD